MGASLIQKVRSVYLRDEIRFDRWGALGKVLATLEAFRLEGIELEPLKLELFVNAAFPRTFSCQRTPTEGKHLPSIGELRAEYEGVVRLFAASGVPDSRLEELAVEEIGERRCLSPAFVRAYLK